MNEVERHAKFLELLRGSMRAVAEVAAHYIRDCSYNVRVNAAYFPADIHSGTPDNGDLIVSKDGIERIIEVKHYQHPVAVMEKWPAIAIGKKERMDRQGYDPDLVFVVGEDLRHCLVLGMATKPPMEILTLKSETGLLLPNYGVDPKFFRRYDLRWGS